MTTTSARPRLPAEEALGLARELYGLEGRLDPLPSERDQNFRLTSPTGTAFVLKIAGPDETREVLDLQNAALAWLGPRGAAVPTVVPTRGGEALASVDGSDGRSHLVRLLSHLPGTVLAEVRPHDPGLLASLGGFLARLDRAFEGFAHPAAVDRDLVWNPEHAARVIRAHRAAITDPTRQALVERTLAHFESELAPRLPALRRRVIHNDANDMNVLVSPDPWAPRRVAGLIDFGDMLEAPLVCELAVAVAYAILDEPNPLSAAASVVAGYHRELALTEEELDLLFPLTRMRLTVSVSLAAHRREREPENEYLTLSERPAWAALEELTTIHPRFARAVFRDACGLAPAPSGPAVAAWLESHRAELAPVLEPDPAREPAVVFDLSVASPEAAGPADAEDAAAWSERLFGRMRAAGARIGIGRYDEARFVYASDAFRGPRGEHPERRTVHLGIDLFVAPGASVRAPLPGRVAGLADNAARLDYGPTILLEHRPADGPAFFTLYGHLTRDSLEGLELGAAVERGQVFARVGAPPENGGWPPHLHFQIVTDLLDQEGTFPGVAAPSERSVWTSLSPDPNLVLRIPVERQGSRPPERGRILEARRRLLGPSLSLHYRRPLHIVRGSGAYLYDDEGRDYLDGVNNVAHVGHGHPRVVAAGARQMAVLNTNTRFLHEAIVRYADRLAARLPEPLRVFFFVCSGSEANELALRLARNHTGCRHLIVLDHAYHGNTQALVDVSSYKFAGPGGTGAPPTTHVVPLPDDYRGPHRRDDPERGPKYAAAVAESVARLQASGEGVAAFFSEALLSCGGQLPLPPGYLEAAYRQVRAAGGVAIADEVQVGFGRVGTHFWAFETQGVVPDIVTMGKPMGNGHPLAAVATTPEIARSFANGMEYFNTFGGNPVSCAIGLAVLDVIEEEGLQDRALRVGGYLKRGLASLADRHPVIGDVRGQGLFLGVELVRDRESLEPAPEEARYAIERLKDHGVLVTTEGPFDDVLKVKPPLVFSETDADRMIAAFDGVLAEDFVLARCRSTRGRYS